ncbi:MAG: ribonuclease Z [Gemmatimonadetes bacterium]|nr:ribonuclease Z [Gemmatimonadota bacterium]
MSLSLQFLGTAASRPTIERNVASLAIVREGETLLVDCGEGTQRQMMKYGVSFNFGDLFVTHWHADHYLGLMGLCRTLVLQDRTAPMRVWAPKGAERMLKRMDGLGLERLSFPMEVRELADGDEVARDGYAIRAFALDHRGAPSLGYALVEAERRGRFNPELARELGIPEGPLWGQLHKGQAVTLPDGRVVEPHVLVGPTRAGRTVVVTGDTRPCDATIAAARGADLLVHEATFAEEEAARAVETGHSTAREAATVAARAGVRKLALTHLSARYTRDTTDLDREARAVFPETLIARDGMEIALGFPADVEAPAP